MARKQAIAHATQTKRPTLKYFFINDQLHRKLEINRGKDLLTAWNFPEGKKVSFSYTDVLKRYEKAFTTKEVGAMINRTPTSIKNAIGCGMLRVPQYTYDITDPDKRLFQYMWSEKDILETLDYFSEVHRGRPRKDGGQTAAANLPTPREVRAMIHEEGETLYIQSGDTFIPTWRAKGF